MVYSFPKSPDKMETLQSEFDIRLDKFTFQENVVISMLSSLIAHNPGYLSDFGAIKSRKLWEIAGFLSEERQYRVPKRKTI